MTNTTEPAASDVRGDRRTQQFLARLLTEVCAPWVLMVALFLAVGWRADGTSGMAWGLTGAAFAALAPMVPIVIGVLGRRYPDHHLTVRRHRLPILIFSAMVITAGIAILATNGAPRDVVGVEAAMLGGLIVHGPITAVWKISFHTGVAAAASVILTVVYGPWLLVTVPLIAAIGWSRVQLQHHTVAQVVVGALVGAVAGTTAFLLIHQGL